MLKRKYCPCIKIPSCTVTILTDGKRAAEMNEKVEQFHLENEWNWWKTLYFSDGHASVLWFLGIAVTFQGQSSAAILSVDAAIIPAIVYGSVSVRTRLNDTVLLHGRPNNETDIRLSVTSAGSLLLSISKLGKLGQPSTRTHWLTAVTSFLLLWGWFILQFFILKTKRLFLSGDGRASLGA